MNRAESYRALARLFAYPRDREELVSALERLAASLEDGVPTADFARFLAAVDISSLQEEYVAAFDFNPACAPYLGHHLFGDNARKGEYMVGVKGLYRAHDYQFPENELPDHLPLLFGFAAHLSRNGEDGERRKFIAEYVVAGMEKLHAAAAGRENFPWRSLTAAAHALCAADCKEADHAG